MGSYQSTSLPSLSPLPSSSSPSSSPLSSSFLNLLPYRWFTYVHPRFRTPFHATIFSGVCAAIATLLMDINMLSDMASIGMRGKRERRRRGEGKGGKRGEGKGGGKEREIGDRKREEGEDERGIHLMYFFFVVLFFHLLILLNRNAACIHHCGRVHHYTQV